MEYKYFKEFEIKNLAPELVSMLDEAREIACVPFIITSGFRTSTHNKEVGGVENSAHLSGLAVDIKCLDSSDRFDIIRGLLGAKFQRIGVYENHIHADIDYEKPFPVIFLR